jgi:hypothetical protein
VQVVYVQWAQVVRICSQSYCWRMLRPGQASDAWPPASCVTITSPGPVTGDARASAAPTASRRDLPRGDPRGRAIRAYQPGVRGIVARARRRRRGRPTHVRAGV